MTRFLKYLLASFLSLLLILGAGTIIAVYVYDDEIESYLIEELNRHLKAKVEVEGGIDFTLFRYFPKASLTFKDIKVDGSYGVKPLGQLQELSLLIDLGNLIKGDYRITKIVAKKGSVNVIQNRSGEGNYEIWQSADSTGQVPDSSSLTVKLEKVSLQHVALSYEDASSNFSIDAHIKQGWLRGRFSQEKFELGTNLHFRNDSMKIGRVTYFPNQQVQLEVSFAVDQTKDLYSIKNGRLDIGGSLFQVSGTVQNTKDVTNLDLKARGAGLTVEDIPRLLPDDYAQYIKPYNGKGKLAINAYIQGAVRDHYLPNIRIQFNLVDGELTTEQLPHPLKSLQLKGKFSIHGESRQPNTLLQLTKCKASYLQRPFSMTMTLRDLHQPWLEIQSSGQLDLAVFHPLLQESKVNDLQGLISIHEFAYEGPLQNFEDAVAAGKIKSSGSLQLEDVEFNYRNQRITMPQGAFVFSGHGAEIKNFGVSIDRSRLSIGGRAQNIMAYWKHLINEKATAVPLQFEGVVQSSYFNLNHFLQLFPETGESSEGEPFDLQRIFHIKGAFSFLVEKLRYRRFRAANCFGDITLQPGEIQFTKFNMKTMNGQVGVNASLNFSGPEGILADIEFHGKEIDIDTLFYQHENFGQSTLTHRHLKGALSTKGTVSVVWESGDFQMDQLASEAFVKVENGELHHFEPLLALSNYIDVNDLKHIRFSTLQNRIQIDKQTIHIPEMNIASNAANLTISGTHTFANQVDYKLRVNLSKILANKFKLIKAPKHGYSRDVKGHLNLFLTMTGPAEDPEIRYDKASVKERIVKGFKDEKEELKRAFQNQPAQDYSPAKEKQQWEVDEEVDYIEWGEDSEKNNP